MKKILLCVICTMAAWMSSAAAIALDDINIRDPFILADTVTGTYYMYCSRSGECAPGVTVGGVAVYKSTDLQNWEGPEQVCVLPADNWITGVVWAPEVHPYKGKYYLFATVTSTIEWKGRKDGWGSYTYRGTQIFRADTPEGPFEALNRLPATPIDEMALDGTLWVEDDVPYMVYCYEWVQEGDGEMKLQKLSDDLSQPAGAPLRLFNASAAEWSTGLPNGAYVTDGCFLYRTSNGRLLMLWSSFFNGDYAIGIAESTTGKVIGPWRQRREPLYSGDGGHGMIFRDFAGNLRLVIHAPNSKPGLERARIFDIVDTGDNLHLLPRE